MSNLHDAIMNLPCEPGDNCGGSTPTVVPKLQRINDHIAGYMKFADHCIRTQARESHWGDIFEFRDHTGHLHGSFQIGNSISPAPLGTVGAVWTDGEWYWVIRDDTAKNPFSYACGHRDARHAAAELAANASAEHARTVERLEALVRSMRDAAFGLLDYENPDFFRADYDAATEAMLAPLDNTEPARIAAAKE